MPSPRPGLPQIGTPPPGPPAWLPLAFLAQAAGWLLVGAAALTVIIPELAVGAVTSPHVIATVHLFTLGVLGAATMGALHQFIPVVTGVPIRHPRAAIWAIWLHLAGVTTLVLALWRWSPVGMAAGWTVLFGSVGLGSWNILPARRRARQNAYVAGFVSLAHSALGLGMVIALVRIGDGLGWWSTWRAGQLLAHFHLGWLGYGTLTIAGIGSKMLPAFLGLREHAEGQGTPSAYRRIGWLLSLGLTGFAIGAPFRIGWLTWASALAMALGVAQHLRVLIGYFRGRSQPLDPALTGIALAFIAYGAAFALGCSLALLSLLGNPFPPRLWAVYGLLAIGGWLTLVIVGVMHRIGARLMTNYLALRGRGLTMAQRGGQLLHPPLSWATVAALGIGTAVTAGGIAVGVAGAARAGAVTYLAGALALAVQTGLLLRQATRA